MRYRVKDKVAIVTGAGCDGDGWGIGKATAVLFAREGAKVLAVNKHLESAQQTCAIIEAEGGSCRALQADVSRSRDVRAMIQVCMGTWGRIDILHNNVGMSGLGGPEQTSDQFWDQVFAVNLKSVFYTCREVLPIMESQGAGSIVNTSSIGAIRYMGIPYISYASSKAALNQFTQSVALQYASQGIRCNAVLPGLIDTPRARRNLREHYGRTVDLIARRNAQSPTGKMGTAWDVAYAVLYLASDEAQYVNGIQLIVDGGLTASCA